MTTQFPFRIHVPAGSIASVCAGLALLTAVNVQAQSIFVSEVFNNTINQFAPNGTEINSINFPGINSLACNSSGDLFLADAGNNTVQELTPGGTQSTFATGMNYPYYMTFNPAGNLFVGNYNAGNITKIAPNGAESIVASGISGPSGIAFNNAGDMFVGSVGTDSIYEISPAGVRTTFATGIQPTGLLFNNAGDLLVGSSGSIYSYAPNGTQSLFASGFTLPEQMAFDKSGNLLVADYNEGLDEVSPNGAVSVIAPGLDGDFGLAIDAVPEPSSLSLLAMGAAALRALSFRNKTSVRPAGKSLL